jgi:hypothetical protein
MGAWGVGHFENDDAMDFVGDLVDEECGWKDLAEVFELAESEYLEAPDAMQIIAAAALIDAGKNGAPKDSPEEIGEWLKGKKPAPDALKKQARKAVERVLKPESELLELWAEAEEADAKAWKKGVEALIERLA